MRLIVFFVLLLAGCSFFAKADQLKTVIIETPEIINVSILVPAVKNGPFVNRSCSNRLDCSVSSVVPAMVKHTKSKDCPSHMARMLAEQTWQHHKDCLPLTIFNGWKWEYYYSINQFEKETYDLGRRGGMWETAMMAELKHTYATQKIYWISDDKDIQSSEIEVTSFSKLRTRYGYPKEGKF